MKRMRVRTILIASAGALLLSAIALLMALRMNGHDPSQASAVPLPAGSATEGTVLLSYYGAPEAASHAPPMSRTTAPTRHRTVMVPGPDYLGMEDNDLRGFLDGAFKYAWNQPSQTHVRLGRRGEAPRYGEHELFRVIQRWSNLPLPPGAHVYRAGLWIGIEGLLEAEREVVLYEVRRDWNPGLGGTLHDNTSPPNPGEAWWNEARDRQEPWGLPGVGFAHDTDPDADTPVSFLARAVAAPRADSLLFKSRALDAYVNARLQANRPLLFLLKLADDQEHVPGSLLFLYSANHGSTKTLARRPRLVLEWDAPDELDRYEVDVHLEHGRALALPGPPAGAQTMAATFRPARGSGPLAVQTAIGERWRNYVLPGAAGTETRALAAHNPIPFGEVFEALLRDTWVRTKAPSEQRVTWTFTSPTGAVHEVLAAYLDQNQWRVRFTPDELGTWSVSWAQQFLDESYQSEALKFDVVRGEQAAIARAVEALAEAIGEDPPPEGSQLLLRYQIRLARLEQALISFETKQTYWQEGGGERIRSLLARLRARLGEAPPNPIPRVADAPPPWARNSGR